MEVMDGRAADDVAWKMGRIMLRYRPIAPKPPAAAPPPPAHEPAAELARGRAKHRQGGKRGRRSRKVVTLPLIPETPERKEGQLAVKPPFRSACFLPAREVSRAPVNQPVSVRVTLESVTEVWACQDEELWRWIETGDFPAFVSDAGDRVTWTNWAYRRLVTGGNFTAESPTSSSSSHSSTSLTEAAVMPEADVRVTLATRGQLPGGFSRAFTCMVSMRYTCRRRGKVSLAVPCDVWRIDGGCLAWRLDLNAALGIGNCF